MDGHAGSVCEEWESQMFLSLCLAIPKKKLWMAGSIESWSFAFFSVFVWFFRRTVCHFFHLLLFYIFFIRLFAAYTTLYTHIMYIVCTTCISLSEWHGEWWTISVYVGFCIPVSMRIKIYTKYMFCALILTHTHTHCSVQCNVVCRCQYKSIKSHGAFYSHYSNEIVR